MLKKTLNRFRKYCLKKSDLRSSHVFPLSTHISIRTITSIHMKVPAAEQIMLIKIKLRICTGKVFVSVLNLIRVSLIKWVINNPIISIEIANGRNARPSL
jgi:hypothetical protein